MTEVNKKFKHLQAAEVTPFESVKELAFPIESTGKIISTAAKDFAAQNEMSLALVANTMLATMSASVHGYANLVIGSRSQPLTQFFCSIAPSGSRKTTVFNAALAGIKEREDKRKRLRKTEMENYKAENSYFVKQVNKLNANEMTKEDYVAARKALGEPKPPKDPTMHIQSGTVEGVKRKFIEGATVLAWHTDEAGSFISGYSMNADNIDATSSFFNGMFSNGSADKNIAKEESASFSNRRLSIHVMPQPKLSRKLIGNGALDDNGLLGRFLLVSCSFGKEDDEEDDDENIFYVEEDAKHPQSFVAFVDRTFAIVSWELPLDADLQDELKPPEIRLDQEAYQLYKRFEKEIFRKVKEGGDYTFILGLALKAHDHAARLATKLFIFDDKESDNGFCPRSYSPVTAEYMQYGIDLMRFYLEQAIALVIDAPKSTIDEKAAAAYKRWAELAAETEENKLLFMDEFRKDVCKTRSTTVARDISTVMVKRGLAKALGEMELKGKKRKEVFELVQHSA